MQNKNVLQCDCYLCQKGKMFDLQSPKIKTTKLCVMILKSLQEMFPDLTCFSIKLHINDFIKQHWEILSKLKIFQSEHWRKSILDALNHCPLIECGKDFCHDRGYYRLKENIPDKKEEREKERLKQKSKIKMLKIKAPKMSGEHISSTPHQTLTQVMTPPLLNENQIIGNGKKSGTSESEKTNRKCTQLPSFLPPSNTLSPLSTSPVLFGLSSSIIQTKTPKRGRPPKSKDSFGKQNDLLGAFTQKSSLNTLESLHPFINQRIMSRTSISEKENNNNWIV